MKLSFVLEKIEKDSTYCKVHSEDYLMLSVRVSLRMISPVEQNMSQAMHVCSTFNNWTFNSQDLSCDSIWHCLLCFGIRIYCENPGRCALTPHTTHKSYSRSTSTNIVFHLRVLRVSVGLNVPRQWETSCNVWEWTHNFFFDWCTTFLLLSLQRWRGTFPEESSNLVSAALDDWLHQSLNVWRHEYNVFPSVSYRHTCSTFFVTHFL